MTNCIPRKAWFFVATFFCLLLFVGQSQAQSPLQFNYQAIARDTRGIPMAMKEITIRFSILDQSASGSVEYSETRKVITNQFGMFTVAVGSDGALSHSGTLKDVKWETGKKFLKAEIDPTGSNNFIDLGATQLVSVPYALFALQTPFTSSRGFKGVASNGVSVEDSVVMLGNKEGDNRAALSDNREIPLNGKSVSFTDGASRLALSKKGLEIQQDSATLEGDINNSGGYFLKVNPIFPRPDAVPFLFNRIANRQNNGTTSPNEVVMWGHNLASGGGPYINGLPGIGYSIESNYKPDPSSRLVESHEFYITPAGKQVRLKSYTINTQNDVVDFYHSVDNFYLKNPRSGEVFFRIDNLADNQQQQITANLLRFDLNSTNKQVQIQTTIPKAELMFNTGNWGAIYFPGLIMQDGGLLRITNHMLAETDNQLNIGTSGNRFLNVFGRTFNGSRLVLKENWNAYENLSGTSTIDIEGLQGFNQFRLRKTYTPTSSSDSNGNTGDMSWDDNYIYIKTSTGWKRTALTSF